MKAVWNDTVIAEADKDELIYIEGNWYFPPNSIKDGVLIESDTPYICPWKGKCQYFDVGTEVQQSPDNAWSYPTPLPSAIKRLHKDFGGYVAFWRDVSVSE